MKKLRYSTSANRIHGNLDKILRDLRLTMEDALGKFTFINVVSALLEIVKEERLSCRGISTFE